MESDAPVRIDARCGRATGKSVRFVRQPDWCALAPVSVVTAQAGYLSGHIVVDTKISENVMVDGLDLVGQRVYLRNVNDIGRVELTSVCTVGGLIDFGIGGGGWPNAITTNEQNCAIRKQIGRMLMAARDHVPCRDEHAGRGNIKLGAGITIAAVQLAASDQNRSVGDPRGRRELVDLAREPDVSEYSSRGVVDFCVVR